MQQVKRSAEGGSGDGKPSPKRQRQNERGWQQKQQQQQQQQQLGIADEEEEEEEEAEEEEGHALQEASVLHAGSLLPAVLNAGVAARAVAEVDGVNAMANGRGAPLGQLADRSQVVCRTTASLGLGLTARDAPNVCWRAQGSYTFDLAQAQLVPDGRGGRSLCLAEPRSLPALQLSLEVEHREAGNTTAGGVRITQRHHVFKPRIPALGLGLDIPVQIDTLAKCRCHFASRNPEQELYGRCKMREGGEVELALDPWSGALSLRGNLAI
ncbi:hypothetical protein ABPG75_002193 [Micractinium tetrahymenae]